MSKYAKGKFALGLCGRCGGKYRLNKLVPDGQVPNLLVHPHCRDIKHEQEKRQIKEDAVILKKPSPDLDDMSPGNHPGVDLVTARGDTGPFFGGGT